MNDLEQEQARYSEANGDALPPLSPLQISFIDHLLTGKNISQAARATGVSRRTGTRWMRPGAPVGVEYERRRLALEDASVKRFKGLYEKSCSVLEGFLSGKNAHFRFAAARLVFEQIEQKRRDARSLERLQDEEAAAVRSLLLSRNIMTDTEVWMDDNPLQYFPDPDEESSHNDAC